MLVIPAIDLIDGKCVRLSRGDYSSKKEYAADPVQMAQTFEAAGLKRLHLVDLDGAKAKRVVNLDVLEKICAATDLQVDFGGGVRSDEDLQKVFDAGAHQVTAGSIAVNDPEALVRWIDRWGGERIILGADVKGEMVAVGAWQETSALDWKTFIADKIKLGVQYVISTDVDRDGMLQGPAIDLYNEMQEAFATLKVIASGGVASLDDLIQLKGLNVYGTIVGKAYYEGRVSLEEMASISK